MNRYFVLAGFLASGFIFTQPAEYAHAIAERPVAFSIVREDSEQDLAIIKRYFPEHAVSMIMVASGGCTAAYLAAQAKLKQLTLVDPNPAQLALTKVKMQMLSWPCKKRLEILGYLPLDVLQRKNIILGLLHLLDLPEGIFGDGAAVAKEGLDFCGRYEKVFEELQDRLKDFPQRAILFSEISREDQVALVSSTHPFGKALDEALDEVMSQDNLVAIFGDKATANRVQDFSRHFAERIRWYLAKGYARDSAWMSHMLQGVLGEDVLLPWHTVVMNEALPAVLYEQGFMNDILEKSDAESYEVVHLSNILDWLSPDEARTTLALAYRALKPGGVVVIRQLNSNIAIMGLSHDFVWDVSASKEFLDNDRSFFYRNFLIGCKPRASQAPRVTARADAVLDEVPIKEGTFFKQLSTMSKTRFIETQKQFFFAVDFFSRPMAALVARLSKHHDRIDIIHNIVEEHGNFLPHAYHSTTFKQFLALLNASEEELLAATPSPVVDMFNTTLMGVAANEDPLIALACIGIIEYAFAEISARIAHAVVAREWIAAKELVHYNLHAELDKQHAEEFFKVLESCMGDDNARASIERGLRLGVYIFNRLYEDL